MNYVICEGKAIFLLTFAAKQSGRNFESLDIRRDSFMTLQKLSAIKRINLDLLGELTD